MVSVLNEIKVLFIFLFQSLFFSVESFAFSESKGQATELPLSKVVLYTSGVGYFQHNGVIEGNRNIHLKMKSDDINDILKSMVVQDFDGGQVTNITYDSMDPITRTLKSFAIDLTNNPNMSHLLEQMRGEEIEISAPQLIEGAIIGTEVKEEAVGQEDVVEIEYLNLLTYDGLRSIPFHSIQSIDIKNKNLKSELEQALKVLASPDISRKT